MVVLVVIVAILALILVLISKPVKRHISITKYLQKLPGPPTDSLLYGNIANLYGPPGN